jgi:Tol biopolymer transport system component
MVMTPSPDGKQILVESFADTAHPVTLYSLSIAENNVKFISATEVGYTTNSSTQTPINGVTTIWRMSLKDMRPVSVAKVQGDTQDVAWSPDGSNLAYLVHTEFPSEANRLWLKVGTAAPRALTPLIPLYGREGISSDEMLVRFSHDGRYLLMVDTVVSPRYFQVWSVPGAKVVWSPPEPSTGPLTMAIWAHLSDRLYYQGAGVRTWNAATNRVGVVASGLGWSSPYLSPDDRFVAYESKGPDGKQRVEVRDLVAGSVKALPGILGRPSLLSDTMMIEAHLTLQTTPLGPYYAVGRYYVRNLLTNAETLLPTGFATVDIWPH